MTQSRNISVRNDSSGEIRDRGGSHINGEPCSRNDKGGIEGGVHSDGVVHA